MAWFDTTQQDLLTALDLRLYQCTKHSQPISNSNTNNIPSMWEVVCIAIVTTILIIVNPTWEAATTRYQDTVKIKPQPACTAKITILRGISVARVA